MDKPISLSVKAWIIRNMSVRTMMQESIIEMVVNHQFDSSYIAMNSCNSIEFSGFGKFFFNKPKALKKLDKFRSQAKELTRIIIDENSTESRKRNAELKLNTVVKNFDHLNKKMNGCASDIRGMEEQDVPPEGIERDYSESSEGETPDM